MKKKKKGLYEQDNTGLKWVNFLKIIPFNYLYLMFKIIKGLINFSTSDLKFKMTLIKISSTRRYKNALNLIFYY